LGNRLGGTPHSRIPNPRKRPKRKREGKEIEERDIEEIPKIPENPLTSERNLC